MGFWKFFLFVVLASAGLCYIYLLRKIYVLNFVSFLCSHSKFKRLILSLALVTGISVSISLLMGIINAVVCIIYICLIWILIEVLGKCLCLISRKKIKLTTDTLALVAILCSILALSCGWYLDHHVFKTTYTIRNSKIDKSIKVAMFADSHIGTTFDAQGFSKHMDKIEQENPDILLIVGDFVDDSTPKDMMIACIQRLSKFKSKYGVFFVMGNHDPGYYGASVRGYSELELIDQLEKNFVHVLKDEAKLIGDKIYVIGRKDFSSVRKDPNGRKRVDELISGLDSSKFLLIMDHQPVEYDQAIASKIDLVVSGHTHGGQLFPFNQAVKWFSTNEMVYGLKKKEDTNFIVSSGLSDWALKFKTGTKSEFVIINIEGK